MRSISNVAVVFATLGLATNPAASQSESDEPPRADSMAAVAVGPPPPSIMDLGTLLRGHGTSPSGANGKTGGQPVRECPGCGGNRPNGQLTIGPGATTSFVWQINDAGPSPTYPNAPGVAGPTPNANNQVSGWSLIVVNKIINPLTGTFSTGDLAWTATPAPGSQFQLALETLMNPTTVGNDNPGPMGDFDPRINYAWPFIAWEGNYIGPTTSAQLTADTLFDATGFANPILGTFALQFDSVNSKQIDIVYLTSVPEPGTLGLVAVGALGVWRAVRRPRR
jgi:hypothetical protein